MKPFRCIICVFFLILILSISVQAAPPMGTWTAPGDFEKGTWEEILWAEGKGKRIMRSRR